MIRFEIDASRCELTGLCFALAPELFAVEDDRPVPIAGADTSAWAAEEIEALCPTRAIRAIQITQNS